jgi:hypothetical protein
MGSAFNCVVVPKNVKTRKDLEDWYGEYREGLIEEYGGEEEFEGYSGDMASDNGELVVTKVKVEYDGNELEKDADGMTEELMEAFRPHVEKWGPSVAIKVGKHWVVGGAYSD